MLVVDDHEVVHWGLRLMLGEQPWVERCLSARNGDEAMVLLARYHPHVALVDLFVGQESGAEICERLRAESPNTNVLLISGAGRINPNAARAAGASGFISKDWPAADIAGAVRMVGLGMTVFRPSESTAGNPKLTEREREVLDWIGSGRDEPRDRGAALPLPAHGQGAHVVALPQALGPQPGRGRAEGAAPRSDLVGARFVKNCASRECQVCACGRVGGSGCAIVAGWPQNVAFRPRFRCRATFSAARRRTSHRPLGGRRRATFARPPGDRSERGRRARAARSRSGSRADEIDYS